MQKELLMTKGFSKLIKSPSLAMYLIIINDASKLAIKNYERNPTNDARNFIFLLKSQHCQKDRINVKSRMFFFLKNREFQREASMFKALFGEEYTDSHKKVRDEIMLKFENHEYRTEFVYHTNLRVKITNKEKSEAEMIYQLRRRDYDIIYNYYLNNRIFFMP